MTTIRSGQANLTPTSVRRLGYLVGIVVSAGLLLAVNNVLAWGKVPFLTDDLQQLLPIINASLVASIAVNGAWILYDGAWFRSAGQIILNGLTIAVLALTYHVFPFDFAAYTFDWETLIRVLIIAIIVALAIATLIEIGKLVGLFLND